ncbi:MAG: CPBP family intramembrane metalloprotease [Lachnospiraceae bacterium]|nr:CPBP family intramembrane metalloprotease [Lachnospiraceae bacterium]
MNSKKVNWLFLCLILIDIAWLAFVVIFIIALQKPFNLPIAANFILNQMFIVVPTMLFLLASKRKTESGNLNEMLGFHKIKVSSFFMIILFTFLIMPMSIALNAISMLFVENTVNAISGDILQMPFLLMLFLIGIFGPFCEELVFRGAIFHGYQRSGAVIGAIIWSAVLFGLMHLNFNQAAYAVALGFMFGLLVEATGSLWSSVIAHMVFNSQQVCTMYLSEYFMPGTYESSDNMLTQDLLLGAIGPYLIIAVIATSIAFCVLFWLAKNENREVNWRYLWKRDKEAKSAFVSAPLIVAIIISLAYMVFSWAASR